MNIFDPSLLGLAGVIIGAAISALSTFSIQKHMQKQLFLKDQFKEKLIRCERIYVLAQSLYDGHAKEIYKLKSAGHDDHLDWLKSRSHPGQFMSDLKMLIKMYARDELSKPISEVDIHHQALKKAFLLFEGQVHKESTSWLRRSQEYAALDESLKNLGESLNALKTAVADLVWKTAGR